MAVRDYLCYGFVPAPRTLIDGIASVAPGSLLVYDPKTRELDRQPLPPPTPDGGVQSADTLWQRIRTEAAAEETAGVLLSGGLDSASVAAAAAELGRRPPAYHARFSAIPRREDEETECARRVADHLGLEYRESRISAWRAWRTFAVVVAAMDQPFADPVTLPFFLLLGEASRRSGRVLTGEGGDQLFGSWATKPMLLHEVYADRERRRPTAYLASFHKFAGEARRWLSPALRARLREAGGPSAEAPIQAAFGQAPVADLREQLRWVDLQLKGTQHILPRLEDMARAHGVALAHPLFAPELLAASFRLRAEDRVDGAREKPLLKELAARHLPAKVVERRKAGMGVPASAWFRGALRPLTWQWLGRRRLRRHGLLDPEPVAQLIKGELRTSDARSRRWGERLWQLCVLEAWWSSLEEEGC